MVVQQGEKRSAESRHAGDQHHAVLTALQKRDPLPQILLVRAAVAGVEIVAGAGPVRVRGGIGQGAAGGHGDGALDGAAVPVHLIAHLNRTGGKTIPPLLLLSDRIAPPAYININIV